MEYLDAEGLADGAKVVSNVFHLDERSVGFLRSLAAARLELVQKVAKNNSALESTTQSSKDANIAHF